MCRSISFQHAAPKPPNLNFTFEAKRRAFSASFYVCDAARVSPLGRIGTVTINCVSGGVDDVWQDPQTKELVIVDYKATSKDEKITTLDQDWHIGYKRQMEVYQWLFRRNGFAVSDIGYFVYANASKDREAFDAKLEFEITLVPYEGNDAWVEDTLLAIKTCLDGSSIPYNNPECDYCRYREAAGKKLQEVFKNNAQPNLGI